MDIKLRVMCVRLRGVRLHYGRGASVKRTHVLRRAFDFVSSCCDPLKSNRRINFFAKPISSKQLETAQDAEQMLPLNARPGTRAPDDTTHRPKPDTST